MKSESVTCDLCGKDITTTGNCSDYRVVLASERIPSNSNVVTLMHVEPDFPRPLHFCDYRCFVGWVVKTYRGTIDNLRITDDRL